MPIKDLHTKPFSPTTITKLEIFEKYAEAWLPTFIMLLGKGTSGDKTMCIFDFFAGTGYDSDGVPGSPIRILKKIKDQIGHIYTQKVKVMLYLNEFEPGKKHQGKFESLKNATEDFLNNDSSLKKAIEVKYYNEDFETLFPKLIDDIKRFPALVYLDQNGVKFLSNKYLLELEKAPKTDFLYFVSSSYITRFGDSEEFKKHIAIDMDDVKKDPHKFINRKVIEHLRKQLPLNTKLKLYPFSLHKKPNIHGIIFGATHPRAVDKFLDIVWKKNPVNGQADFDIDDDHPQIHDLFTQLKISKIEAFKANLVKKLLSRELRTNADVLDYVFNEGHIPQHASDCIKHLKKEGGLFYEGRSPLITYSNVYSKDKKIITYQILGNEAK